MFKDDVSMAERPVVRGGEATRVVKAIAFQVFVECPESICYFELTA